MYRMGLALCLMFSSALLARDTLARDARAAQYRTGAMDTAIARIPPEMQRRVFVEPSTFLPQLTSALVVGAANDFEKAKRIHDWITDNIAYDADLLLGLSDEGSRRVLQLLPLRRTTCSGVSRLFQEMADQVGLKAVTITAAGKTMFIPKQGRFVRHVYNAVQIGSVWYIVDVTADLRLSYKFGKFSEKRRYVDRSLFLGPGAKVTVNLPLDPAQQFLERPTSEAEFRANPRVTLGYYAFGFRYDEASLRQFTEGRKGFEGGYLQKVFDVARAGGRVFTVRFQAHPEALFYPGLAPGRGESVDDAEDARALRTRTGPLSARGLAQHAFCHREGDVICQFTVPAPGTYKAYIQAKFAGETGRYSLVHSFTLIAEQAGPVLPEETGRIYENALFPQSALRLRQKALDGPFPFVELENARNVFLTALLFDATGTQVKRAVDASYVPGGRRFYFRAPIAGTYFARIQTRVPDREGGARHNVAVVRFEAAAPGGSFPPPGALFFTKRFQASAVELLSEDVSASGGVGVFTIRLRSNRELECALKHPVSRARLPGGCAGKADGRGLYEFRFQAPDGAEYYATVNQLEGPGGSTKASVLNFRMRGR